MLSSHDHGNCELCDWLETEQAALEAKAASMERTLRLFYEAAQLGMQPGLDIMEQAGTILARPE